MTVVETVRRDEAETALARAELRPATVGADFGALVATRRWRDPSAEPVPTGPPPVPGPAIAESGRALVPAAGPDLLRSAVVPPWIDGRRWLPGDHAALRRVLGGRYDAHARVVTRILAEEPGLRTAMLASPDLPAALVAVRAYCAGDRTAVGAYLRGEAPAEPDDEVAVVARCAAYGLRRLPAVFGPVFRAGAAPPGGAGTGDGWRSGVELTEPGFIDADLGSTVGPDAEVEYVIWSVGAGRLGALDTGDGGPVVFPPASRFEVLAVDEPAEQGPPRVLLREIPHLGGPAGGQPDGESSGVPDRRGDLAERLRQRLRAAGTDPVGPARVPLPFVPGLDGDGRPFPPMASRSAAPLSAATTGQGPTTVPGPSVTTTGRWQR